jgi:hypothetical protein
MAPAKTSRRRMQSRRVLLAAALAFLGAALAPAAFAQHPGVPQARSLAARVALADAVAIATVTAAEPGRLTCGDVRVLAGTLPERFEVKRGATAPPPLGVGDRAIFLLRGARPPYVLVDQPKETIRLADAAAEARWAAAVGDWLAVRSRPAAWIPLYERWIDEGPDTLRELAVNGLTDKAAPFQPIPDATSAAFADRAWDAARSPAARRVYALLASFSGPGGERLADGLLTAPLDCDAGVAAAALQAAPRRPAAASAIVARGLDHSDAEVRRAALSIAQVLRDRADPGLRARIERVSREDAESWLRAEAERTLTALAP